ncbi:hypothetical protein PHISCL_07009 [Aspergillus sclerotialis]|uniref:Uncharacterized protein n=1 Tax=Aspergillus sclerotialis TaxID=2070753 RepID=A0A3A2ZE89_9EURO|nr:hypothetical protein PHISCL_07009 [Aspergillus sclerotialis]
MAQSEELLDAPDGSAYTWILDHWLRYPATYEIPLRTMYDLNCNSMRQQGAHPPETSSTPQSSHSSKSSQSSHDFSLDQAASFKAQLSNQIARLPSQPCSLPPSFITNFLRRCFAPQFEDVDFHQALTALDYLRDLETRRRRELTEAVQRLNLKPEDMKDSDLGRKYPGLSTWIESMKTKTNRVESLYSQVYINLRRWTLINEMMTEPYNKANCIAMLNTLFPPVSDFTTATPQLTPQVLKSQRDGFFRYIKAMDTNDKQILDQIVRHGAQGGEKNGWPLVRDALDKYLRTANEIIDECSAIDPSSLMKRSQNAIATRVEKWIQVLALRLQSAVAVAAMISGGSLLERLARELRKNREGKSNGLKKTKSNIALAVRTENVPSHSADSSLFDIDDQKRKRLIWEAKSRKRTHSKQASAESLGARS